MGKGRRALTAVAAPVRRSVIGVTVVGVRAQRLLGNDLASKAAPMANACVGLSTRSNHGGTCPSVTREDGGVGRNSCGLTWWSRPVNWRDRDRGAVGCRSGVVAGRDAATWLASRRRTLFPEPPRSVRRSFERRRSPLMFLFGPAPPGPRPARPPGIRRPAATAAAHSSPTL